MACKKFCPVNFVPHSLNHKRMLMERRTIATWHIKSFPRTTVLFVQWANCCLPRRNRPYALILYASLGDDKKPGGLGATLTQINWDGKHCIIAHASRKLQKHKCNYTPFLLEIQAAILGINHFGTYLRGRKFALITDHRPLEKLGKVHIKTLNWFARSDEHFWLWHYLQKSSEMPAGYYCQEILSAPSLGRFCNYSRLNLPILC